MNHQDLSKRLERVADFVPAGARLADIGSDHGFLPAALALRGVISFAVAGEVVEGPFLSAKHQVEKNQLTGMIEVRLADGLEAIHDEDEIDTITICGMGGTLIRDILERGKNNGKLTGRELLILQPNVGECTLRNWLCDNSYCIIAEDILEEKEKIYEIIVAEPYEIKIDYTKEELFFGPKMMLERNEAFQKKWRHEMIQREKILASMQAGGSSQTEKERVFQNEIQMIQEVLNQ